jgi:phage shock protein A
MTRRAGLIARFTGLVRGWASGWLRDREEESPRAVYEHAISERVKQYRELKEAVAGILYMRNKLEGELAQRRGELARTHADIRRAVQRGNDEVGLALISHKQILMGDIERAQREYEGLRAEAEEAKTNLVDFREEIRALEREKSRIVATLANAKARRRMSEALEGLSVDADMRALENVREHVARLATEGDLDKELGADRGLAARIREIREEANTDAARRELDEIKRQLSPAEIPARSGEAVPLASS